MFDSFGSRIVSADVFGCAVICSQNSSPILFTICVLFLCSSGFDFPTTQPFNQKRFEKRNLSFIKAEDGVPVKSESSTRFLANFNFMTLKREKGNLMFTLMDYMSEAFFARFL